MFFRVTCPTPWWFPSWLATKADAVAWVVLETLTILYTCCLERNWGRKLDPVYLFGQPHKSCFPHMLYMNVYEYIYIYIYMFLSLYECRLMCTHDVFRGKGSLVGFDVGENGPTTSSREDLPKPIRPTLIRHMDCPREVSLDSVWCSAIFQWVDWPWAIGG